MSNNNLIIKNTGVLYIRTLFSLCIKLYTSRLILEHLGISDYGVYSVVASFIAMFSLFSDSLTTTIQRFLTYSLGERNYDKVQKYFSASVCVLLSLSIFIVVVAEIIGVYYIQEKMVIPDNRVTAAVIVFQLSLLTFVISILSVPYNAILTANENFKIFAYIDILDSLLILLLVVSLKFVAFDKLVYYAVGLTVIAVFIRILYQYYCRKKYDEAKFKIIKDKQVYLELLSFSSLTFLGQAGVVIGEGGINLVMNAFFGVSVNATRGVSTQVSNAVGGFIRSFTTALNPQITKSYADGQYMRFTSLVYNSSKFSFLLLMVFMIPVYVNIDFLLDLWLTKIPPLTDIFVRIMLVQSLIHVLFNAPTTAIYATGKIKLFQSITFVLLMSNIVFIYILYLLGRPVYEGLILQCFTTFTQLLIYICILKRNAGMEIGAFVNKVVFPCFTIFLLSLSISFVFKMYTLPLVSVFMAFLICILMTCLFGLSKEQKVKLYYKIKSKL